jgi:hypothetical protein
VEAIFLIGFIQYRGQVARPKRHAQNKDMAYESGIITTGSALCLSDAILPGGHQFHLIRRESSLHIGACQINGLN